MKYLLTTCCKEKNKSQILQPAIERYLDPRIGYVQALGKEKGVPLLIFSGKYGVIHPATKIPYYDLKLTNFLVPKMVSKTVRQLRNLKTSKIEFYGLDPLLNTEWEPYYEVIKEASKKLAIDLEVIYLDPGDYV